MSVSASLSDSHLTSFSRGSISLAQILWKVSVLFVLALWAVSLRLRSPLAPLVQFLSFPLAHAISGQTQAGLGYIYAKGRVWVGLYQFLRNNRTIAAVQLLPKLRFSAGFDRYESSWSFRLSRDVYTHPIQN